MGLQRSDTLEGLEQVLHSYDPNQRTATSMVISGPEDLVHDELALLAESADLFDVDVATVCGEAGREAFAVFDGNAGNVARLVAFVDLQLKGASAR